jgi:hypothetical protein
MLSILIATMAHKKWKKYFKNNQYFGTEETIASEVILNISFD